MDWNEQKSLVFRDFFKSRCVSYLSERKAAGLLLRWEQAMQEAVTASTREELWLLLCDD